MSDRVINDLFIDNQPAKLYAPNIIAGLEDTDAVTQLQNDIAAEATRAEDEEARIEALFTAPTQEAVDNWLDEHPEATTTVQDGAITLAKLHPDVRADVEEIDGLKENLSDIAPFVSYAYKKSNVRSGSLQANTVVSADSTAIATGLEKTPLSVGETIKIIPTMPASNTYANVRIACYPSSDSTSGTLKVISARIPDDGYLFTQPSGFSHILVCVYYHNSDDSGYTNVLDSFTDTQNVLVLTNMSKRVQVAYESEILEVTANVTKAQADATKALGGVYGYYPIAKTAEIGWRSSSGIYSSATHYHVNMPVLVGEKYHIRSNTINGVIPNYTILDANNNPIAFADGNTSYIDEYITIPQNATTLVINSHHIYPVTIEKYTTKSNSIDIEPYFFTEISDTITKAKSACTEKALVFAVVTDSHVHYDDRQVWDDTVKNILKVNDDYQIDGIVHLGDIINGDIAKTQEIEILDYIRNGLRTSGESVSYVEGNHDLNSFYDNNSDPITEAEMYANMFRFNASEINRPNGKLYGYRDYDMYGIRAVYLLSSMGDGTHGGQGNNWGYPQDELTWVQDVALDTDKQVVFFSHMQFTEGMISTSATLPTNGNALKAIVSNFIDNGGTVVGLFHGHTHWDYLYDNNKFKEVSIAAETYQYNATDSHPTASYAPSDAVIPARLRYTVNQDLWDLVVIRPTSRTVKLIRFGSGTDREFSY